MHIFHDSEDGNLTRLLSFSVSALTGMCGPFDITANQTAKELVFERTRYAYNDALEYFQENFLHEITRLGMEIEFENGDYDATV